MHAGKSRAEAGNSLAQHLEICGRCIPDLEPTGVTASCAARRGDSAPNLSEKDFGLLEETLATGVSLTCHIL
jgi:hypothetical protein